MKRLLLVCLLISGCMGGQMIVILAEEGSSINGAKVSVDDGGTDFPGILWKSPVDVGELDVGGVDKSRKPK